MTIKFSNSPFTEQGSKSKDKFKAGDFIYARVFLDEKLLNYIQQSDYPNKLSFSIQEKDTYRYSFQISKSMRRVDFENNYIDFDIYPEKEKAMDDYGSVGFFYSIFGKMIQEDFSDEKVSKVIFTVSAKGNTYEGWKDFVISGDLEIDYSEMTNEKFEQSSRYGFETCKEGENNFEKITAKLNSDYVKKLPLPNIFSICKGNPYSMYNDEDLRTMIKNRFQINEILKLCYYPSSEKEDFLVYKDNGIIQSLWGTKVFYFIFRDPIDGFTKATGGVLVKPILSDGTFDSPYIRPITPIQESDSHTYPGDNARFKLGYESVVFVDGDKA